MSTKKKSALLSLLAIILVLAGLWQLKRAHWIAALVLCAAGIVLTILYFTVSVPDFINDVKRRKK